MFIKSKKYVYADLKDKNSGMVFWNTKDLKQSMLMVFLSLLQRLYLETGQKLKSLSFQVD